MATFGATGATLGASIPNRCSLNTATKHPICLLSTKRGKRGVNLVAESLRLRYSRPRSSTSRNSTIMAASATEIEKAGVKIVRNPPESKLSELGVRSWSKWGCPPSKFPWTYSATEMCYLLEGKVKVYPDGSDEAVEIGAGDLVIFPKGMSCTWDVSEAVDKHYKFD